MCENFIDLLNKALYRRVGAADSIKTSVQLTKAPSSGAPNPTLLLYLQVWLHQAFAQYFEGSGNGA